jgi:hypothetical protein
MPIDVNNMRNLIRIVENVGDFSQHGAHYDITSNDPRFGDNPLENQPLLDFEDISSVERLHIMLNKAGVGDEEIKDHVTLSELGRQKVAARLGVGPQDVEALLGSLEQSLKDADAEMVENYHGVMAESDDTYTIESDALGSQTIRSGKTGKTRFVQGSAATALAAKLAQPGVDQQTILRSQMMEAEGKPGWFKQQIAADSGSYNFPWTLHGKTGFGTAFYRTDRAKPELSLTGLRDADGKDIEMSDADQNALKTQAMRFIKDA